MASPLHLVGRFFATLWPAGPSSGDEQWARVQLLPSEIELWIQMWRPDRRHGVAVARRVQESLGDEATRPVLAAALLHDVGKLDSNLHTYGRVVATLSGAVVRHDEEIIRDWTRTRGYTRRVGLYLRHPRIGGDRLGIAGSDPLTETWAREHHMAPEDWSVPSHIARALKDADDD